eukprot:07626_2
MGHVLHTRRLGSRQRPSRHLVFLRFLEETKELVLLRPFRFRRWICQCWSWIPFGWRFRKPDERVDLYFENTFWDVATLPAFR